MGEKAKKRRLVHRSLEGRNGEIKGGGWERSAKSRTQDEMGGKKPRFKLTKKRDKKGGLTS